MTGPRYFLTPPIAVLLLAAALVSACASSSSPDDGGTVTEMEAMSIDLADGASVHFKAEIAESPQQRAEGLMNRTELAPDSGMLFIIEPPGRGFWMKDTILPLTVAFIAPCGEIVDFADLEPLSEEIKNTENHYVFALEMERGWFAANGVAVGDVTQLPDRLRPGDC